MEAVLGLLVISAGVSHGLETSCDAREDECQCYGALGGTVYLQLVTDTTRYAVLSFWKGSTGARTEILRMKKDKWVIKYIPIKDRGHFFINNGTFRLNNTRRNDSGEYLLETFNSSGVALETRGLELFIEAPVSSPQLSSECLSHGEMRVSCSSEGDSSQYSWTLDGQTLRDTETSPDNETNTITLKKGLSGDLTCTVRNNINSDTVSRRISHCPGLIYVTCTLSNGTKVSEWVNTLCVESTTVVTVTESPTSKTSTDPLKLCQVGWGASLQSYFEVSPEMEWALPGPLKDIQRLVLKPLLRCFGCVLRDVVLFEGEPLPQSDDVRALEQNFT